MPLLSQTTKNMDGQILTPLMLLLHYNTTPHLKPFYSWCELKLMWNFTSTGKAFVSIINCKCTKGISFKSRDLTIRLTINLFILGFLSKNLDIYTSESGFHEINRIIERLFLRLMKTQSLSIFHEIRSVSPNLYIKCLQIYRKVFIIFSELSIKIHF